MSVFMWKRFVFISLHITHYIFSEKLILLTDTTFVFPDVSTTAALYGVGLSPAHFLHVSEQPCAKDIFC